MRLAMLVRTALKSSTRSCFVSVGNITSRERPQRRSLPVQGDRDGPPSPVILSAAKDLCVQRVRPFAKPGVTLDGMPPGDPCGILSGGQVCPGTSASVNAYGASPCGCPGKGLRTSSPGWCALQAGLLEKIHCCARQHFDSDGHGVFVDIEAWMMVGITGSLLFIARADDEVAARGSLEEVGHVIAAGGHDLLAVIYMFHTYRGDRGFMH